VEEVVEIQLIHTQGHPSLKSGSVFETDAAKGVPRGFIYSRRTHGLLFRRMRTVRIQSFWLRWRPGPEL
jgi:hypothetical protein